MTWSSSPKLLASALLIPVITSGGMAAAQVTESNLFAAIVLISHGAKFLFKASQDRAEFNKNANNSVIISNLSQGSWSFGYLDKAPSELSNKQSGTVNIKFVDDTLSKWKDHGELRPGGSAIEIPREYKTIIITPIVAKTGMITWEPFFRVCYLQDLRGNRVYLNIAKGTANADLPTVGLAQKSYASVMEAHGKKQPVLEIYQNIRISENNGGVTNVLAIKANGAPGGLK